tara:strand:- start:383 stop:808 length:426 start_codon:yes stop_codon:yes gene_type:complete
MMVSKERLQGSWHSVVGAVKEKFGQITGDDLSKVEGDVDQLVGLLQRKAGQSREQVESFLNSCCRSSESTVNRISESAAEYADAASQAVRENYDRLAADAQRGYESTVKTMRRRPLESVAIALGAGVLAGLAVGISLSSRR